MPVKDLARSPYKEQIELLVRQNKSLREIVEAVGCSKRTASYHRAVLLKTTRPWKIKTYDWTEVQSYYDAGHSARECCKHFAFSFSVWSHAAHGGLVKADLTRKRTLHDKLFCKSSPASRAVARRRILIDQLLPYTCSVCGSLPIWQGKPMPLILDHINGVNNDHRLENLRFVCPNCNTQLPTFCSKNLKFQRDMAGTEDARGLGPLELTLV